MGWDLNPKPGEYKIQNHELRSNFTFTISPLKKNKTLLLPDEQRSQW